MKRFMLFCFAVFVTGLLSTLCEVRADVAPLQVTGGAVELKSPHQTIRMDSEEVTIRLEKETYTVEAVFQFSNSGGTVTEWVGFPRSIQGRGRATRDRPDFIQFHAWIDGKAAPFAKEGEQWLARQVSFPGHTTTTIRIVYEADYYRGSSATYMIGTGSRWKDRIGRAAFTVDGSAIGGSKHFSAHLSALHFSGPYLTPPRLTTPRSDKLLTDKAVRFELKNYEPEPTLTLEVHLNSPRGR